MPKLKSPFGPYEWLDYDQAIQTFARGRELTPAILEEIQLECDALYLDSPIFAMRNFYKTIDKQAEMVRMNPFSGQAALLATYYSQLRADVAQRIIEIKPRQVGWSTICLAIAFHRVQRFYFRALILVPDDTIKTDFMLRIGTFYDNLPKGMRAKKRLDNIGQLIFENADPKRREKEPGLSSSIHVAIPSAKRGGLSQFTVFSEFAHWPEHNIDVEAVMEGVLKGQPLTSKSCIFIDTTPLGHDDYYEPMVEEAIDRNPEWVAKWDRAEPITTEMIKAGFLGTPDVIDEWVPIFWPWRWHEEYTSKDESPFGQLKKLTTKQRQHIITTLGKLELYGGAEEEMLHHKFQVSIPRLAWRRKKIAEAAGADWRYKLLTFKQEYAHTYKDCFQDYEFSPFDPLALSLLREGIKKPTSVGLLYEEVGKFGVRRIFVDQRPDNEFHQVRFWAGPEGTEQYLIAVDQAGSWESEQCDKTVAQVLRRSDRKQVAVYEARVPPHIYYKQIYMLYRMFNDALLTIECNINPYAVRALYEMGARNQFHYKREDQEIVEPTKYLGWYTNNYTRPDMENALIAAIGFRYEERPNEPAPQIILRDKKTIDEIETLKRNNAHHLKGSGRNKDDHAIAIMINCAVDNDPQHPYVRRIKEMTQRREPTVNQLATKFNAALNRRILRNNPSLAEL